jgi:hypothetical protein
MTPIQSCQQLQLIELIGFSFQLAVQVRKLLARWDQRWR